MIHQPWRLPITALLRSMLGAILALAGAVALWAPPAWAQPGTGGVVVAPIHDTIDLGLAPYLARVLEQAEAANAQAVILDINTPGGRLDAALQMRDAILDSPMRTVAFVNREAFSAGALIALAAETIYMTPGAVMGAATPVDAAGDPADPKVISAVRSTFRSTAELRGRDPLIAEAMVDPALTVEGLVGRGELLTLTTTQAQASGYADGVVANRAELLAALDLTGAPITETTPSPAENVVRFLTNPAVASLLMALGFLLILADVLAGGFGLVGLLGLLLFALFFWGHFLAGLAGWESVALVGLGLLLIGAEIFVIPGFGVAGILGIAALLGGLFLALIGGRIVTNDDLVRAGLTVIGAFILMIVGAALMVRYLPRWGRLQGLILETQVGIPSAAPPPNRPRWLWLEGGRLEANQPPPRPERPSLTGATGVALSDLRPGGFARIDGERVDVVTQGDYINAGERIEVIADEGYRRVVRRQE